MTQTTEKHLGRWHLWWLRQFKEAHAQKGVGNHGGGMFVSGWEGTIQGKALIGLLDRQLISYSCGFEDGGTILYITEKGLAAWPTNHKRQH